MDKNPSPDNHGILSVLNSHRCIRMLRILDAKISTVSNLSSEMGISMPTTSYYIKRLLLLDLVQIHHEMKDLRVKRVEITMRGRNALRLVDDEQMMARLLSRPQKDGIPPLY